MFSVCLFGVQACQALADIYAASNPAIEYDDHDVILEAMLGNSRRTLATLLHNSRHSVYVRISMLLGRCKRACCAEMN
jgi:hypothetical protein